MQSHKNDAVHGNGDVIRSCEGSRNYSIPIGLSRFSRRGQQGSAPFQEIMISRRGSALNKGAFIAYSLVVGFL